MIGCLGSYSPLLKVKTPFNLDWYVRIWLHISHCSDFISCFKHSSWSSYPEEEKRSPTFLHRETRVQKAQRRNRSTWHFQAMQSSFNPKFINVIGWFALDSFQGWVPDVITRDPSKTWFTGATDTRYHIRNHVFLSKLIPQLLTPQIGDSWNSGNLIENYAVSVYSL